MIDVLNVVVFLKFFKQFFHLFNRLTREGSGGGRDALKVRRQDFNVTLLQFFLDGAKAFKRRIEQYAIFVYKDFIYAKVDKLQLQFFGI